MAPMQSERSPPATRLGKTVLVGPIRVRSATLACPFCESLTVVHALLVTAVLSAAGHRSGPMLVTGVPELPESSARLSLLAPNLVLAANGASNTTSYLNQCSICRELLTDALVYETEDAPFGGHPASRHPSDVILQTRDLAVREAIVRD